MAFHSDYETFRFWLLITGTNLLTWVPDFTKEVTIIINEEDL
jgi:hypothetical protein